MSIYMKVRSDGTKTWYYAFNYKKRTYRGIGGTTKTQAIRVQEKVRAEVINGEYELKRTVTNPMLSDFAEKFLERRKSHRSYERDVILVRHLLRRFRGKALMSITVENVENYKGLRLKDGVSNATVNRELACLKRMFNLAIQWGDASHNPVKSVKYLDEPEQKDRYVTRDEAKRLLEAATEHFRPILIAAFSTGMRLQEILGLRWKEVTLNSPPKTRLADGRKVADYGIIELEGTRTKNKRNREIPINRDLHEVLIKLERKNEYVFLGTHGDRLHSIRRPMATALKRSGIEKATFHDFRGSWATWMSQEGVDPFTIKDIGGWRDMETVLRYVHRNKTDKHWAMNKIAGKLKSRTIHENGRESNNLRTEIKALTG